MTLTLRIENETSLPDGGPLSVVIAGKRGVDIGRDAYLDWTLPDPTRFISGKHCEVRWHDGGYWLHDISTNGTFLDGEDSRLRAPHPLRNGDRFLIGRYIIVAELDDQDSQAHQSAADSKPQAKYGELWDAQGEAAPPIDPRMLKAPRDLAPVKPDFLDWAIDVPSVQASPTRSPPPEQRSVAEIWDTGGADSWSRTTPKPPPPAPDVVPVPTPRRPVWVTAEPDGPWAAQPAPKPESRDAGAGPDAAQMSGDQPDRVARAPHRDFEGGADTFAGVTHGDAAAFVRLVARAARLDDDALAKRDPGELATELGELLRLVTDNMKQLLEARQHAKRLARSSDQTMIQALENNPIKFAPTVDEAMRIMFGPPTRSYLDARRAFTEGFNDLKSHQVKTYTAMQQALTLMFSTFDPAKIEADMQKDRGLIGAIGSRKARLWDNYVTSWQTRIARNEDGLLNAYMEFFAECYDREQGHGDI
jgi:type VI secretion system protein ImpI